MAKSKKPGWKDNQQKKTGSKTETTKVSNKKGDDRRKVFMLTDYRTFAKKGQVYTVDHEKADELVKLKRATEYESKKHSKAPKAN